MTQETKVEGSCQRSFAGALLSLSLATSAIAITEWLWLYPNQPFKGYGVGHILGFACLFAWVCSLPFWLVTRRLAGKIFSLPTMFCSTIGFWFVLNDELLTGGTAQNFAFYGVTAVVMAGLGGAATSWLLRVSSRRVGLAAISLVTMLGLRVMDYKIYPGQYPLAHATLALLSFVFGAAFLRSVPWENFLRRRGKVILVVLMIFAGWKHQSTFLEGDNAGRAFLMRELVATRSALRLVPYADPDPMAFDDYGSLGTAIDKSHREARLKLNGLKTQDKPNILFISVDAVRADHTSLLGYGKPTTPFLEELAKRANVFSSARSPATTSYFSIASMLSGSSPRTIADRAGYPPEYLAQTLKPHGYEAVSFASPLVKSVRPKQWRKEELFFGFENYTSGSGESSEIGDQFGAWLNGASEPFFAYAHLMDPHHPYTPKEEFFGRSTLDRYDGEIRQADQAIRSIIQKVETRFGLANTIIVVTSDHGESFGERGQYFHGLDPFEEQCHVPLLIALPWQDKGRRIDDAVVLSSLPATLCDLVGVAEPANNETLSLLPHLMGIRRPDAGALTQCIRYRGKKREVVSAYVKGRFKLLQDESARVTVLYDLKADPGEKADCSARLGHEKESMLFSMIRLTLTNSDRVAKENRREELLSALDSIIRGEKLAFLLAREVALGQDSSARQIARRAIIESWTNRTISYTELSSALVDPQTPEEKFFQKLVRKEDSFDPSIVSLEGLDPEARRLAIRCLEWRQDFSVIWEKTLRRWHQGESDAEAKAEISRLLLALNAEGLVSQVLRDLAQAAGGGGRRLLNAVTALPDATLGPFLKQLQSAPQFLARIITTRIGASTDSPLRRDFVERFLRVTDPQMRALGYLALSEYKETDWRRELLLKMAGVERNQNLREQLSTLSDLKSFASEEWTSSKNWSPFLSDFAAPTVAAQLGKGVITVFHDKRVAYLTAPTGELFLGGAKEPLRSLTIVYEGISEGLEIRVALNDSAFEVATLVEPASGKFQFTSLGSHYKQDGPNTLKIRVRRKTDNQPPQAMKRIKLKSIWVNQ